MGKIKRGILGGVSGKVANVVGGSWKGIAYIRALPLSVANPKTAAQQAQRGAFGNAVAAVQKILTAAVKPLWDRFVEGQSGFNAWISANVAQFDAAGLQTPGDIVMSRGSLLGEDIFDISGNTGPNTIGLTWASNAGTGNALALDDAYLVGYNATKNEWGVNAATVQRQDLGSDIQMESVESGDEIHAWLSFRRQDGSLVSNSSHATEVVA